MYGWLATLCFSISPLFLAERVMHTGHARGLSAMFIWPWALGEVFAIIHTFISFGVYDTNTWPLYFNYLTNAFSLGIIIKYKYKERF